MSALKPVENMQGVSGAPARRYPFNKVCAHPECKRTDVTGHHIFGRRGTDPSSWFVSLRFAIDEEASAYPPVGGPEWENLGELLKLARREEVNGHEIAVVTFPHVTHLCGHGTEGHHGDAESHEGWIKLEDGVFVWYQRESHEGTHLEGHNDSWRRVGPLNPQPGSREGKPKRQPRDPSKGPVKVASFKAPDDDPESAERVRDKAAQLMERFNEHGHAIGRTVAVERALDYTLLNAGPEDF